MLLSPLPIVLLCGGRVPSLNSESSVESENSISLRDSIYVTSPPPNDFEIFYPEEITDWQIDGIFSNLIDFEKSLAGITSLVVIILESAGSIAELGAFSQLPELKNKLIVVVREEYVSGKNSNSFINLG